MSVGKLFTLQWQQEKYECDFLFGSEFNSISTDFRTRMSRNELENKLQKAIEDYDWIIASTFGCGRFYEYPAIKDSNTCT